MTKQAAIDARSTFPAILRELLDKHPQTGKRTTLKELGEAVGTRQQSISLYKNGDTQPSPDILIRIAAYFGVSVDYLLTGISSENKAVHEQLGLSEQSVRMLQKVRQLPHILKPINDLLSDTDFYMFLLAMDHKFNRIKDLEESGGWELKKGFDFMGYFVWDMEKYIEEFIRKELVKRGLNLKDLQAPSDNRG